MYKVKPKLNTSFGRLYSAQLSSKSLVNQQFEREQTQCRASWPLSQRLSARISYSGGLLSSFQTHSEHFPSACHLWARSACSHENSVDILPQRQMGDRPTGRVQFHCFLALHRWSDYDRQLCNPAMRTSTAGNCWKWELRPAISLEFALDFDSRLPSIVLGNNEGFVGWCESWHVAQQAFLITIGRVNVVFERFDVTILLCTFL